MHHELILINTKLPRRNINLQQPRFHFIIKNDIKTKQLVTRQSERICFLM